MKFCDEGHVHVRKGSQLRPFNSMAKWRLSSSCNYRIDGFFHSQCLENRIYFAHKTEALDAFSDQQR